MNIDNTALNLALAFTEAAHSASGTHSTYLSWKIALTTLHILAVLSTIYRLSRRWRTRRLWWDDFFVFLSTAVDVLYLVVLWLRIKYTEEGGSTKTRIVLYWLSPIPFFFISWTSRISLALGIARILAPGTFTRKVCIGMAVWFGMCYIATTIAVVYICTKDTSWHTSPTVQCRGGGGSNWMTSLLTSVSGDFALVTVSMYTLSTISLARNPRRLMKAAFASSILTTISSLGAHAFLFAPKTYALYVFLLAQTEAAVGLLVCNLLIVVTAYYRVFRRGEDLESDSSDPSKHTLQTQSPGVHTDIGQVSSTWSTTTFTDVSGMGESGPYSEEVSGYTGYTNQSPSEGQSGSYGDTLPSQGSQDALSGVQSTASSS